MTGPLDLPALWAPSLPPDVTGSDPGPWPSQRQPGQDEEPDPDAPDTD